MFLRTWLVFLISGVLFASLAVLWAVRSRQFEETDRARYIPLRDLGPEPLTVVSVPRRRLFLFGNLAVLLSGALAILLTLVLVLRHV